MAEKGIKSRKDINARDSGMIINSADLTKDSYSYYGYQYYSYAPEGA